MKRSRTIVLDSWAVMAYIQDEAAASAVADIIADAREENARVLMSVVNAGEVWYCLRRKSSDRNAGNAMRALRAIGIEFIDVDWTLTQIAAGYKANGGISYADCFAAALARLNSGTLVTGDREFKRLEKEITIKWL